MFLPGNVPVESPPPRERAPDETPSVRHHLMIVGLTLVMVIPVSVFSPLGFKTPTRTTGVAYPYP
jgi:hypothetical protein